MVVGLGWRVRLRVGGGFPGAGMRRPHEDVLGPWDLSKSFAIHVEAYKLLTILKFRTIADFWISPSGAAIRSFIIRAANEDHRVAVEL